MLKKGRMPEWFNSLREAWPNHLTLLLLSIIILLLPVPAGMVYPDYFVRVEWFLSPPLPPMFGAPHLSEITWSYILAFLSLFLAFTLGLGLGHALGFDNGTRLEHAYAHETAKIKYLEYKNESEASILQFYKEYDSLSRLYDIWIRVLFEHNDALGQMIFKQELNTANRIQDPAARAARLLEITPDYFSAKAASMLFRAEQEERERNPPSPLHSASDNRPDIVQDEADRALDADDLDDLIEPNYFQAQDAQNIINAREERKRRAIIPDLDLAAGWYQPDQGEDNNDGVKHVKIAEMAKKPILRFQRIDDNATTTTTTTTEEQQTVTTTREQQAVARLMEAKVYAMQVKQRHQKRFEAGHLDNFLEDTEWETSWSVDKNGEVMIDMKLDEKNIE